MSSQEINRPQDGAASTPSSSPASSDAQIPEPAATSQSSAHDPATRDDHILDRSIGEPGPDAAGPSLVAESTPTPPMRARRLPRVGTYHALRLPWEDRGRVSRLIADEDMQRILGGGVAAIAEFNSDLGNPPPTQNGGSVCDHSHVGDHWPNGHHLPDAVNPNDPEVMMPAPPPYDRWDREFFSDLAGDAAVLPNESAPGEQVVGENEGGERPPSFTALPSAPTFNDLAAYPDLPPAYGPNGHQAAVARPPSPFPVPSARARVFAVVRHALQRRLGSFRASLRRGRSLSRNGVRTPPVPEGQDASRPTSSLQHRENVRSGAVNGHINAYAGSTARLNGNRNDPEQGQNREGERLNEAESDGDERRAQEQRPVVDSIIRESTFNTNARNGRTLFASGSVDVGLNHNHNRDADHDPTYDGHSQTRSSEDRVSGYDGSVDTGITPTTGSSRRFGTIFTDDTGPDRVIVNEDDNGNESSNSKVDTTVNTDGHISGDEATNENRNESTNDSVATLIVRTGAATAVGEDGEQSEIDDEVAVTTTTTTTTNEPVESTLVVPTITVEHVEPSGHTAAHNLPTLTGAYTAHETIHEADEDDDITYGAVSNDEQATASTNTHNHENENDVHVRNPTPHTQTRTLNPMNSISSLFNRRLRDSTRSRVGSGRRRRVSAASVPGDLSTGPQSSPTPVSAATLAGTGTSTDTGDGFRNLFALRHRSGARTASVANTANTARSSSFSSLLPGRLRRQARREHLNDDMGPADADADAAAAASTAPPIAGTTIAPVGTDAGVGSNAGRMIPPARTQLNSIIVSQAARVSNLTLQNELLQAAVARADERALQIVEERALRAEERATQAEQRARHAERRASQVEASASRVEARAAEVQERVSQVEERASRTVDARVEERVRELGGRAFREWTQEVELTRLRLRVDEMEAERRRWMRGEGGWHLFRVTGGADLRGDDDDDDEDGDE